MTSKFPTRIVPLTNEEITRQLTAAEARHGMTSAEFLRRYNSGELGDDLEFIRWAGLLRTAGKAGMRIPART